MQTAKILLPILALIASASSYAAAQELKTISECRAYREAWFTSEDKDIQRLSVRELYARAQQMTICGRDIDKEPLTQGMTCPESVKAAIDAMTYGTLAAGYYQEAFNRAAWFLDGKNLTTAFIADDAKQH